jgi:nucleotide-binding universal stress UspA family protein
MIEIRKILCPTDFSEFSRHALDLALALAKWYQAEVTVVHVLPRIAADYTYLPEPVVITPVSRERALEELGRFVHESRRVGVTTEVALEEGDTVRALLALAKKLPADLLVMGTHGRGGFERFVLGSVTEKVLRQAPCPVLTLPKAVAGAVAHEPALFKKILCPVDFSSFSLKSLEFALSLAEEADAHLTLLHVLEFVPDVDPRESLAHAVHEYRARLETEARERLRATVPNEVREWCEPEELVEVGRPASEILRVAEEQGTELIVIGVQGRSALDLAVFGSTTHQVVRGAKCPVLTIRSGP